MHTHAFEQVKKVTSTFSYMFHEERGALREKAGIRIAWCSGHSTHVVSVSRNLHVPILTPMLTPTAGVEREKEGLTS